MKKNTLKTTSALALAVAATSASTLVQAEEVVAESLVTESTESTVKTEVTSEDVTKAKTTVEEKEKAVSETETELIDAGNAHIAAVQAQEGAQKELDALQTKKEQATDEVITQTQADYADALEKQEQAVSEQASAKEVLDKVTSENAPVVEDIKKAESEVANEEVAVVTAQNQAKVATEQVTKAQSSVTSAEQAVTEAQGAVDTATKEVTSAQEEVRSAEIAAGDKVVVLEQAQAKVAEKEKTLADAKEKQTTAATDVVTNQTAVTEKQAEVNRLAELAKNQAENVGVRVPLTKEWLDAVSWLNQKNSDEPLKQAYLDLDYSSVGSEADRQKVIDVRNLSREDLIEVSQFYVNTINAYHEEIEKLVTNDPDFVGKKLPRHYITENTIKLAEIFAKTVQEKFPNTNKTEHGAIALTNPEAIALGVEAYNGEALKPGLYAETMADLKEGINRAINQMLFADGKWSHAHTNIITNVMLIRQEQNLKDIPVSITIAPTKVSPNHYSLYITPTDNNLTLRSRQEAIKKVEANPIVEVDYSSQLATAKVDLVTAKTKLTASQTAFDNAKQAVAVATTELEQAKQALTTLDTRSNLAESKTRLANAEKDLASKQVILTNAQATLKTTQEVLAQAESKVKEANLALATANTRLSAAKTKLETVKATHAEQVTALNQAQVDYDNASKNVENAKKAVSDLETLLASYLNVDSLLATAKEKLAQAETKQEEAKATLDKVEENYQTAKKELVQAEKEYATIKSQFDAQEAIKNAYTPTPKPVTTPTSPVDVPSQNVVVTEDVGKGKQSDVVRTDVKSVSVADSGEKTSKLVNRTTEDVLVDETVTSQLTVTPSVDGKTNTKVLPKTGSVASIGLSVAGMLSLVGAAFTKRKRHSK